MLPEEVPQTTDWYCQIDYGRLTPVSVQASKEQKKQVDELKKLVAELAKER